MKSGATKQRRRGKGLRRLKRWPQIRELAALGAKILGGNFCRQAVSRHGELLAQRAVALGRLAAPEPSDSHYPYLSIAVNSSWAAAAR